MARVNGRAITEKDLRRRMNATINRMYFHRNLPSQKEKEIKKKALEALIVEELIYQKARQQKIKVDKKEINYRFEKIIRRFKSRSDFKKALKESGYSEKDLKEKLEKEYLIEEAYRQNVLEEIELTEKDLWLYYNENKSKFKKPESINLQHILIKVKDPASEASWQDAKKKAQELIRRLKSGEDFTSLASLYSEDMYRIKGGHLGEVHRGRLVPEIEAVGFSLAKGEISQPIKTEQGFHIIKVLDKKESRQLDFDDIKDKLKKDIQKKYETEARNRWIKKLKSQAKIKIYIEFE